MWLLDDKPVKDEDIDGYFGFVYSITNLDDGRMYIGKKFFTKAKTKQKRGRKIKLRVDSDWKDYWGSSDILLKDIEKIGKDQFKRDILRLCKTKGDTNYYEAKYQFLWGVLEKPERFYNGQIRVRATINHLSCNKKPKKNAKN